ncbi:MAG: LysM peptidoglycan-binding domain-containing protein [Flavobacteriales bacterium]
MIKNLFLSLVFLSIQVLAFGQDYTLVERDGEQYYSHKVESGHTLYAIAVLYDSDEEIIREYNSELLAEGLKVGQIIYVPVSPSFKPGQVTNPIRIEDGFLVHRVLKKETLFSICQRYTVDVNDVLELNPKANSGLQKGMELKIPVNDVNSAVNVAPPVNFTVSKYKTHIVKPGETLYGVSRTYDVKIKDILDVNDGLPKGLKAGNIINLPLEFEEGEAVKDSITVAQVVNAWERKRKNPFKETYEVAMALPLYTNELDSGKLSTKERRIQRVALNFYRGAYLAAQKLEEEGLSMNLNVLNVTDDKMRAKLLPSDPRMQEMDLFIGPFQKEPLTKIIEVADITGAHVVCPTPQSGKILLSHANVSKVRPSGSTLMGSAARHIAASPDNPNVILIKTKWVKDKRNISVFEQEYYAALEDSAAMELRALKSINVEDLSASSLKSRLSLTRPNVIVLPTEEKISLGKLVNVLPFLRGNEDITIYLTDKWLDNNYIDANTRNKFNVHFPSTFSRAYGSEHVEEFSDLYNDTFDDVVDEYSVLGYDIMLYYGRGLKTYGVDLCHYFNEISTDGILDHKFDMRPVGPDSGYENHGTHIMYFENFEFKKEEY